MSLARRRTVDGAVERTGARDPARQGQENGGPGVPGAHSKRSSAGAALPERGHRVTVSRHCGLPVPGEGLPSTSGTEAASGSWEGQTRVGLGRVMAMF